MRESGIPGAYSEGEGIADQRRISILAPCIVIALMAGPVVWPAVLDAAIVYGDTITGVADHDGPGGTGGYDPGYSITVDGDGALHYHFAGGDSVELQAAGQDVFSLASDPDASPIALDVPDGLLTLSAIREEAGTWGLAVGIDAAGNTVAVDGDTRTYARADDSVEGSGSGAHAVISRTGADGTPGSIVFNGVTDLHARSPGYARAVWVRDNGDVTFNGPTTILGESRGTLDAVYNSSGGSVFFNGDTAVSALGIWPSDNAHAIYNDNINTHLRVDGNLSLTTISQGSTAFGVRNQGVMEVNGGAEVNVEGPRSSHGIANTHRLARMTWRGDVDVRVRGGSYVPFGNPSGISNDRTPGARMRFEGAVNADVASAAETYGIVSTGMIEFTSDTAPVSMAVASTCDGCSVYGIRNYGILSVAAGLSVSTVSAGDGPAWSIWSLSDTQDAVVSVNQAGGHAVRLEGDVVTAADPEREFRGAAEINLDTADSYLRGLIGGWTDFATGQAVLSFSNGAAWIPRGTGTLTNDLGTGSLSLGGGGVVDLGGYWGSFAPGAAVPAHSDRELVIDSSDADTGAAVSLDDGAYFLLLSDITGSEDAVADRIVFDSGISSFSTAGTLVIGIHYDPVLDDPSWVNADTLRDGTIIEAATPIVIADAGAAAGGTAVFPAVEGLEGEWSQTFENAPVTFTYVPVVSLSADGRRIVLDGIAIQGSGVLFEDRFESR